MNRITNVVLVLLLLVVEFLFLFSDLSKADEPDEVDFWVLENIAKLLPESFT